MTLLKSLALIALLAGVPLARGEDRTKEGQDKQHEHEGMMLACAKACSDCQRACDSCATHCADMLAEGKKDHKVTLATCRDCASVCAAASQIVARGGPFSVTICTACAEACAKCAKECEKFPDNKHMKMCAEECRKCEKSCTDMIKHMAGK